MSLFDNPNWARDLIWKTTLDGVFQATDGLGEDDHIELIGSDYICVRIFPEVTMLLKLPENAENFTTEEFHQFMDGLTTAADYMYQDLKK